MAFLVFASFTKPRFSHVQHQQYFINCLFNIFVSASSFITIGSDVVFLHSLRCLKITVTFVLSGLHFLAFFNLNVDSLLVYNIGFLAGDELSPSCIRRTVVCLSSWSVWACLCLANSAVCLPSQVRSSVSAMLFVSCKHYTRSCVLVTNYLPLLFWNQQKMSRSSSLHGKHYGPKQLMWIFVIVKRMKRLWNSMQTIFFKLVYCTWISCRGECTY